MPTEEKQTDRKLCPVAKQREKNSEGMHRLSLFNFFFSSPNMVFPPRDSYDPDCLSYASGLMRHSHTNYRLSVAFPAAIVVFLGYPYTCSVKQ